MIRTIATVALLVTSNALAAPTITEWSGRSLGTDYNLTGVDSTNIVLIANGTFKFQSLDGANLSLIDNITVANGVTGTVTVYIERDTDDNSPGATDVGSINLTNTSGVTGNLAELRITGSLGTSTGVIVTAVTGNIVIGLDAGDDLRNGFDASTGGVTGDITIAGDIDVGSVLKVGDMVGSIDIGRDISGSGGAGIVAGDMTGNITVTRFLSGSITAASLVGNITLSGSSAGGDIAINSGYAGIIDSAANHSGDIAIGDAAGEDLTGTITFTGLTKSVTGAITIAGDLAGTISITDSNSDLRGVLTVNENLTSAGKISIGDDLISAGRIWVKGDVMRTDEPPIHIKGKVLLQNTLVLPAIQIDGTLNGVIAIDGALDNVNSDPNDPNDPGDAEILIDSFATGAGAYPAIAVNYDGADEATDEWGADATIIVDTTTYTGNTPADSVYEVSKCMGDMNGDQVVDDVDDYDEASEIHPYALARDNASQYAQTFPGLEGSRVYHGNCNGRIDGTWAAFDSRDNTAFANLIDLWDSGCCGIPPEGDRGDNVVAKADISFDYVIDLTDLGTLLINFGAEDATAEQGDTTGEGDVDLTDLGNLLTNFGQLWCPDGSSPSTQSGDVTLSVAAWDTSGYSGGGFEGEDEHFVFDAKIEMEYADDDWTTTGAVVTRANGAVFRLVADPNDPPVPGSSKPDKFATFFSVPKNTNNASRFNDPFPSGGIAGAYDVLDPDYVYTTTLIDATWFDLDMTSNDGPAAVLRIVIDVSGVSGADTSAGFGSVYFSTSGATGEGDIKVADFEMSATNAWGDGELTTFSGEFFVTD